MQECYLRPADAAEFLKGKFGFGAARSLAKLRTIGGGPEFRKIGRIVVYEPDALDSWARSRMTAPVKSTAELAVA